VLISKIILKKYYFDAFPSKKHLSKQLLKGVNSLPEMEYKEKKDIIKQTYNVIQFCLFDKVLREVVDETTIARLWGKKIRSSLHS